MGAFGGSGGFTSLQKSVLFAGALPAVD